MRVVKQINELRQTIKQLKGNQSDTSVGFVPTMGYLHAGHASLMEAARKQTDIVVLSIFVNPLQFGPNEDFDKYPRDHERDLKLAEQAGVDIVFLPEVSEMYPRKIKTAVSVAGVTERLCGASRPGHFDGVATVVSKLFNIVKPNKVFFGMKDAQQIAVIRQMVDDLNMDITVVPCPTLREEDGLALSSRNVYLSAEERKQALVLSSSLRLAEQWIATDRLPADEVKERVIRHISEAPLGRIDYVEILTYPGLEPVESGAAPESLIVALAVKFGTTRLIDNVIVEMGS
ncbi:pantoate--beta-alanine ligase [Paenibacillus thalictri]|uniref:Pantothenate synthetase n=1 Tax=Paenibacillus thalictri TaxID=2527873 RepID=A0A4Q9DVK2_9BACL|nr:pantoate--beta-alanine ligase [Paenibacillus thalictri]TBL79708.1 pantoate--beta-alanine ligase [Paenibacillus thalictri]